MKRKKSHYKVLTLLITVLMLIQLLPVNSFAAGSNVKLTLEPSAATVNVGDVINIAIVVTNTDSLPDIYSGGAEPRGVNGFNGMLEYDNSGFTPYGTDKTGYIHGTENPLTDTGYAPHYEPSAVKVIQMFDSPTKLTNLSDTNGDKKITLCSLKFTATKTGTYTFRTRASSAPSTFDGTYFVYLSGGKLDGYDLTSTSTTVTVQSAPTPPIGDTNYSITYDKNGATSGSVPIDNGSYINGAAATVLGNTGSLAKKGYTFNGWNTKADGTGTSYAAGSKITLGAASVVLYAVWSSSIYYNNEDWLSGNPNNYIVAYYKESGKKVPLSYYYADINYVLYKAKNPVGILAKYNFVPFSDISDDFWAGEYIWFMSSRDIINGMGDGTYQPESNVTRAQFVKILASMVDGVAFDSYANAGFSDVKSGEWYEKYINWAFACKIVDGYGNGRFGPNDPITREQMCCIIERFVTYLNYTLQDNSNLTSYVDESSISAWALKSVKRLQGSGLINGKPNNQFDPLGKSTRAEAATITCRLLRAMISNMESNGRIQWTS